MFGFAFEWVFLVVGLLAGTPQAAQGLAFLIFPLTFVSSAYVPVDSMPGWLQAFAQHQPVTYMVDAVRALTLGPASAEQLGHSAGYFTAWALVWAAGIVAGLRPTGRLQVPAQLNPSATAQLATAQLATPAAAGGFV